MRRGNRKSIDRVRRGRAKDEPLFFERMNARVNRASPFGIGKTGVLKNRALRSLRGDPGKLSGARPAKTSVSYLLLFCLVVALVTGAFIWDLHVQFEAVRLGYQTSQARAHRTRLLVERRELRLELASLKAPEMVEAEAREKLGMEMPDYRRIVPVGAQPYPVLVSGKAE